MGFTIAGIYHLFDYGLLQWIIDRNGLQTTQTAYALLVGGGLIFCVLISYLLGSINFALVVSKVFFHDDVRKHGSGNAGATNITRTYGKKAGVLTFLGDGLKGVVAILIACALFGSGTNLFPHLLTASYLSAFMCIVGHVFPIFARFHGGKGFATTAMCIIALNPFIAAILLVVFLVLVLGTKYISLGSVVASLFYPIFLSMFDQMQPIPYGVTVLFAFLIGALVTWAHRGNLKRIYEGTERRMGDSKTKEPDVAPVITVEPMPWELEEKADGERRSQPKSKKNQKKLKKGKK